LAQGFLVGLFGRSVGQGHVVSQRLLECYEFRPTEKLLLLDVVQRFSPLELFANVGEDGDGGLSVRRILCQFGDFLRAYITQPGAASGDRPHPTFKCRHIGGDIFGGIGEAGIIFGVVVPF
jgi:hypothetical protein